MKFRVCVFCLRESEDKSIKNDTCPKCGAETAFKPELETKLFIAQSKLDFAKTALERDRVLGEMYLLLNQYTKGKLYKKLKKLPLQQDDLDDYCHDASTKFIEHYLKDPEFRIKHSFGGYLGFKIWDVLHNKRKKRFEENNFLTNEAEVLGKMAFSSKIKADLTFDVVDGVLKILKVASDSCFYHWGKLETLQLLVSFILLLKSYAKYRDFIKTLSIDFQPVVNNFCLSVVKDELVKGAGFEPI